MRVACFDSAAVWNVDIFLAATPFIRSAFDRRVHTEVEGRKLAVVSVEDLLLFNLLANRTKDRLEI